MSMQEVTAVISRFQAATDALAALLGGAGCMDVHSLTRTWPIPFGFVTGHKA